MVQVQDLVHEGHRRDASLGLDRAADPDGLILLLGG
jgi:hypothetical protein